MELQASYSRRVGVFSSTRAQIVVPSAIESGTFVPKLELPSPGSNAADGSRNCREETPRLSVLSAVPNAPIQKVKSVAPTSAIRALFKFNDLIPENLKRNK